MSEIWVDLALWSASALVFAAFFMTAILPLRAIAVASNIAFVVYAIGAWNVPIFVLHAALLPLNIVRIQQHRTLARRIRQALGNTPEIEKLVPLMDRQHHKRGTVLFNKGDHAKSMFYLVNGRVEFPEFEATIGPGNIFGEIALFLNDKSRTASAVCVTDCEICALSEDRVKELALQDSAFGLFLTKLIAVRMNENSLATNLTGDLEGDDKKVAVLR